MQHLSTAFLIIALVIVVNEGQGVTPVRNGGSFKLDQIAEETKTKKNALTLIEGPKYVAKPEPTVPPKVTTNGHNHKPEQRPPSKPPLYPDKPVQQKYYVDIQRPYYASMQKLPSPRPQFSQPIKYYPTPNALYNFPKVIPLSHHKNQQYYIKQQPRPILYASTNNKTLVSTSPKFSLPIQTIKGVRTDFVKPPKYATTTITTTAATLTTTKRYLRTKRIWPKKILEKMNSTLYNNTKALNLTIQTNSTDRADYDPEPSITRIRYVFRNATSAPPASSRRPYRPVTRIPKIRATTPVLNISDFENSDWVPIIPSHYTRQHRRPSQTRISRSDSFAPEESPTVPSHFTRPHRRPSQTGISRRSDSFASEESPMSKRLLYLQSFGLIPMQNLQNKEPQTPEISRKKMVYFKRKRQLNPYYSGAKHTTGLQSHYSYGDLLAEGSGHSHRHSHSHGHYHSPKVVTKIKHHHHHHHHRYVKKVPVKVEVPKPYPVTVEKKVPVPVEKIKVVEKPYPVTVEKKVPYPIGIKVPHPVPYKVVEKQYVPKPYPVVQHVKVPHPVPVQVEKKVPVPYEVRVPVDRPVPYPVTVEKQVPYPVAVKVLVPQPYPVEKRVPYPVEVKVKEPVEVIKHVHVKVPYPQPFAVKVPQPYPVEKRVPYPVEVEKKVPVYIPKPYPVEKKVPVKVPYPVKVPVEVPVQVPVEVPIYIHSLYPGYNEEYYGSETITAAEENVTSNPQHTVTVHGNTGFTGFHSRSDNSETATTSSTPTS